MQVLIRNSEKPSDLEDPNQSDCLKPPSACPLTPITCSLHDSCGADGLTGDHVTFDSTTNKIKASNSVALGFTKDVCLKCTATSKVYKAALTIT